MAIEFEINENIMSGSPVLRGTRITVGQILAELAEGHTVEQVEKAYDLPKSQVTHLLECLSGSMDRIGRALQIQTRLDRMDKWYGDTIISGVSIDLQLKIVPPRKRKL